MRLHAANWSRPKGEHRVGEQSCNWRNGLNNKKKRYRVLRGQIGEDSSTPASESLFEERPDLKVTEKPGKYKERKTFNRE